MKKTATALLAAVAALVAGVLVMITPAPAQAGYESKRLDMKVNVRCAAGDLLVVVRLHDTRPAPADPENHPRYQPYSYTWKYADDGDPWNTWGKTEPLMGGETRVLRFRLNPGQEWVRLAISDETDTQFARKLMLNRRFVADRNC